MDDEGLWRRKSKAIPLKDMYARLTQAEREQWLESASDTAKPAFKKTVTRQEREALQRTIFNRLSYDEKLVYCDRPEQIDGPSAAAWEDINAHLGTDAQTLPDLVQQLGERQFGHVPRVGDAFCGGGSVPFEAARLGCEAYGSDLNPVAALLTWAALHIVGGGPEVAEQVRRAQQEVYEAVDRQVTAWGIEHNEQGWRADAYLYCNEVTCPECGWRVPLAPSWVIGEKTRCIAELHPDPANQRFDIRIVSGVSSQKMAAAKTAATVKRSALACPHCGQWTPMAMLRGDRRVDGNTAYGLRLWENDDLVPRPDDVFRERLYCIRWVETVERSDGSVTTRRHYRAPDAHDLQREDEVLQLLRERFHAWQVQGYLPSRRIEPGDETTRLTRERGWTHWHHLFHPRQLLNITLLLEKSCEDTLMPLVRRTLLLGIGRYVNWGSSMCVWNTVYEETQQTFLNQALNTLMNFGVRTLPKLSWYLNIKNFANNNSSNQNVYNISKDARSLNKHCDIWITDPPYADAINYHELSEFFLAWYAKPIRSLFPEWYADSKRVLALSGSDEDFCKSMVDCYYNLATYMPDNGFQIVMFTHQDTSVWANLALILWASGLQVTTAWTIATETEAGLKAGNYVQGTVLLVLRKQTSDDTAFLDEIYPEVEHEVKAQLDAMMALEDQEDPNFGDTDYQLAAYAAALRVLTQYKQIEDIDIAHELSKPRRRGEKSPIEQIIADAVKVACDHLVPLGFDPYVWKTLIPDERFYLKGLDLERHGEYRAGAYQELARGFGVKDYKPLLAGSKANQTRLKTASEFGAKVLDEGFGDSLVRHALFAVRETTRSGETLDGKTWLRTEGSAYWQQRKNLITILRYLSAMGFMMPHWQDDANSARLLAGALENDSV
jgi:adenine-specific DNA methylase